MDQESNVDCITQDENNFNINQRLFKDLRKERDNIMKQQAEDVVSEKCIQKNVVARDVELNNIKKMQSELEFENRKLNEVFQNDIQTKHNVKNDVERTKTVTEILDKHFEQLRCELENIEIETGNMTQLNTQINEEMQKYSNDRNTKQKEYIDEVSRLEELIKNEINNNNNVIQMKKFTLCKKDEELQKLVVKEQEEMSILEQAQIKNSEIINEIKKQETQKENCRNEYANIKETSSKFVENHNSVTASYEEQIITLRENIEKYSQRNEEMQQKHNLLKKEHDKQDEAISLHKVKLHNLETLQCSSEDNLSALCARLEDLKNKSSNLQKEINFEIELLNGDLKHKIETSENFEENIKGLQETFETEKQIVGTLKEELKEKSIQKEDLLQRFKETELHNIEVALQCENEVKLYNDKISDARCRLKEVKSTIENMETIVEDKSRKIEEIEDLFQMTLDERTATFAKRNVSLKEVEKELTYEMERHKAIIAESHELTKHTTSKFEKAEKKYKDRLTKIEEESKLFKEKMDTFMKNNNDTYIKEKRSFEDSMKTMLSEISEYRTSKDNLQEDLAKKIREILDVANKIEAKKAEKIIKNSQSRVFKSPIPPKTKQPRKIKSAYPVTSTPKKIMKKTTDEENQTEENFPLTQKAENKKNEPTEKTSNRETVDADKKISATQKPSQKLKPKKLDFSESAAESQTKHTDFPNTQIKDTSNMWPTDLETSDDGLRKKTPLTKTSVVTEKSQAKHTGPTKTQNKNTCNIWGTDFETSDDGFSRNTDASQIKPNVVTEKSQTKHTGPTKTQNKNTCNIWGTDFETSDDGFSRKTVDPKIKSSLTTEKPNAKNIESLNSQTKKKFDMWATENDTSDDDLPRNVTSTQRKIRSPLTQKPRAVFEFPDDESPIDAFDSLKNNTNVTSAKKPETDNSKSALSQKKRSVYEFSDNDSPIDVFDSLKTNTNVSSKKPEVDNNKSSASSQLRKRPAVNYYVGDSSDDSFFDKIDKSKKIQSNLKSSSKPSVISLDSTFSENS